MMSEKRKLGTGIVLLAGFIGILVIVFSPVFNGQNGMEYLDALYNSISKGSAYYIPKVKQETSRFFGNRIAIDLAMADPVQAQQVAALFGNSGAMTSVTTNVVTVEGDLGQILENCLKDADLMYLNQGQILVSEYGYNEKQVLYNWYQALKSAEKALKNQKKFNETKVVVLVIKKAVECAYNYYNIEPKAISESLGIVTFSLVFYVVYTMWYGYAIMFIFEGLGLKLAH